MRVIELFKEISKIPRCSKTHIHFIKYIQNFCKKYNYICDIDNANNIVCYKKDKLPKICLQSHYDIVCLEKDTIPIIVEKDGYLIAKDSTLGADNGIGCAYMLALMAKNTVAEFLFTSDEEIGLIGANNINLQLKSSKMLNLDSETQGEICVGCAGGIDIYATNNNRKYKHNKQNKLLYEISIENLDGGHSGVDIDKNIPNAIKLLAKTIKECDADLLDINGGQRINSIPKSAKAIITSSIIPIPSHKNMKIIKIDTVTKNYKKLDDNIINFLYDFKNGVQKYNQNLKVTQSSINLAIITNTVDEVKIDLSVRAMQNDQLQLLTNQTIALLEKFNFNVTTAGKYPAWKPIDSEFTFKVLEIYKRHIPNTKLTAIHAGLECAIFKDKFPDMQICSIGPNINFPHSNQERCEIKSIFKLFNIIEDIIKQY